MVFMSHFDENCKKLRLCKKDTHVTVQMRRMNSRGDGPFNLCADLPLRLFRFDILRGRSSLWPQITGRIKQAGNFVFRFDRTPAIDFPFARQRKMQPQIRVGMFFRVGSERTSATDTAPSRLPMSLHSY